jgi:hypothetical protein
MAEKNREDLPHMHTFKLRRERVSRVHHLFCMVGRSIDSWAF